MNAPEADLAELRRWTAGHGLDLAADAVALLSDYRALLELWAARVALVGAGEVPLLVRKHFADSLYAASRAPLSGRVADLGSGAGLPGIPVAIARPHLVVELVESRRKKASFLADATRHLSNARVVNKRIEDLPAASYDVLLARALAPLESLLPLARPALRDGGELLAMKSVAFEKELAGVDVEQTGFVLRSTDAYTLPTNEQRVLLHFEAIDID